MRAKNEIRKLLSEALLLRGRVAAEESDVKDLREQFQLAKRRRKEAKRMAQLARKQFKKARAALLNSQRILAEAEAKLEKAGIRAPVRKSARARVRRKTATRVSSKSRLKPVGRKPARIAKTPKPLVAKRRRKSPIQLPLPDRAASAESSSPLPMPAPASPIVQHPTPIIYEEEHDREEERQAQDEEI